MARLLMWQQTDLYCCENFTVGPRIGQETRGIVPGGAWTVAASFDSFLQSRNNLGGLKLQRTHLVGLSGTDLSKHNKFGLSQRPNWDTMIWSDVWHSACKSNQNLSTNLEYVLPYTSHCRFFVCVRFFGHRGSSRGAVRDVPITNSYRAFFNATPIKLFVYFLNCKHL